MRRLGLLLTGACLAATAAAQDAPPDLPKGAGPRGTSGETPDDMVGYATVTALHDDAAPAVGIAAAHPNLPRGSFVEVTALDTGRTIAVVVIGPFSGRGIIGLSPQAADALGIVDGAAIRVRSVVPSPYEQAALRAGKPTGARLDAPESLLVALRKRLPANVASHAKPVRGPRPATKSVVIAAPVPAPASPKPVPVKIIPLARGSYGVQVAALSSTDRAAALARSLGGHVVATGALYRVQLGPFADAAAAARARDGAVRAGYRDARIFHSK